MCRPITPCCTLLSHTTSIVHCRCAFPVQISLKRGLDAESTAGRIQHHASVHAMKNCAVRLRITDKPCAVAQRPSNRTLRAPTLSRPHFGRLPLEPFSCDFLGAGSNHCTSNTAQTGCPTKCIGPLDKAPARWPRAVADWQIVSHVLLLRDSRDISHFQNTVYYCP